MVCIPCFVIPALLFVWYRFLQPIFLRIWNPFRKVEASNEANKSKIVHDSVSSNEDKDQVSEMNEKNKIIESFESNAQKSESHTKMKFPDTIKGFGYEFSEDGTLQQIDSKKPFQFEVKEDDHSYNQRHYEALGEVITSYIYSLLEEECGLRRFPVPIDSQADEPETFIFCSENFKSSEKLLVLIHGSGVVRAGQWARRLIINDSLQSGTQIPFIKRGIQERYGILIMNTNDNYKKTLSDKTKIRGSGNPEEHGNYVWENYIRQCAARKIAIIAHSYGGVVTTRLFENYKNEFLERVFAVALTDSVHFHCSDLSKLFSISQNWVTSEFAIDTPVPRRFKDIPCVSAGCVEHEMTSWKSFESIFRFLEDKLSPTQQQVSKHSIKIPTGVTRRHVGPDDESSRSSAEENNQDELIAPASDDRGSIASETERELNFDSNQAVDDLENKRK